MKPFFICIAQSCAALASSLFGAESADPFMGDWKGVYVDRPDDYYFRYEDCYAQVVALGEGNYRVTLSMNLDERSTKCYEGEAIVSGERLIFSSGQGGGSIEDGVMRGALRWRDEFVKFELKPYQRKSPTLEAKVPRNAKPLYDGSSLDAWRHDDLSRAVAWLSENGILTAVPAPPGSPYNYNGLSTREDFRDVFIHLEFKMPFEPANRGQGRGNSGLYFQSNYEIQILDSYGLEGLWNECGAIYQHFAPKRNMSYPPLQWQTYDILFRAPGFDEDGKKLSDALMTAYHNGKEIHYLQPIPGTTDKGPESGDNEPGAIHLQDHGHPVSYRNIWVVDVTDDPDAMPSDFVDGLKR